MAKKSSIFFEIFCGEFVEIVTDLQITNQVAMGEDGQVHEMKMPLTLTGFVMYADEEFIYLSPDGESVNQAFPKSDLKHIQIVDLEAQVNEIFDIPDPAEGHGYN